jgi:3-hydroxyisobutyrate dehydrogenase-like beta-hydroxyacid dehydrogenase
MIRAGSGGAAPAEIGRVTIDAGARPSAFDIAQEIVATSADGGVTIGQALKLLLAVMVGKVSGAGTSTITFRDVNDTKDRVVADVDTNGNRTNVTKDVS